MRALIVPDIDGDPGQEPGSIELREGLGNPGVVAGSGFRCPCGCGKEGWLPVNGEGSPGPSWEWDGNRERPTLAPSVLQLSGCRWHGWLRNGEWVTA